MRDDDERTTLRGRLSNDAVLPARKAVLLACSLLWREDCGRDFSCAFDLTPLSLFSEGTGESALGVSTAGRLVALKAEALALTVVVATEGVELAEVVE